MQGLSDEQLLQLLKEEKEEAFWILYDRYVPILLYEAYQVLGRKDEAQDVVQEVLIRFWHRKHYHSVETSLKLFLFRSVRNESLNVIRYRKRQSVLLKGYSGTLSESFEQNPAENQELRRAIQRAHKRLPPQQALAFQLTVLEKRKKKEVADAMGISLNSVKTHLRLAVKALKKQLGKLR